MKNIKYIIFMLLFLSLNIFCVNASCTNEEIYYLKEDASKIKITYKHKGPVDTEEGTIYSLFDVTVKNLNDDFYVSLLYDSIKLTPVDGIASTELSTGKWKFKIYSTKCNMLIDDIDVSLPTFNMYSLDPLCEGIDGDDFPLCGKYYEYDVSYEEFENRVKNYRDLHNLDSVNNDGNNDDSIQSIIDDVVNFVAKYKYYVLGVILALLIVMVILIIVKRNKKRGVLE